MISLASQDAALQRPSHDAASQRPSHDAASTVLVWGSTRQADANLPSLGSPALSEKNPQLTIMMGRALIQPKHLASSLHSSAKFPFVKVNEDGFHWSWTMLPLHVVCAIEAPPFSAWRSHAYIIFVIAVHLPPTP